MVVFAASIDFVLAIVGTVLGFVAVAVGLLGIFLALRSSKGQIKQLDDVRLGLEKTVEDVRGEVATRFIGRFPDFMPRIVKAIEGARKEVMIFCDLPAYGVVSNPDCFRRYKQAVSDKVRDDQVEVRMVYLDHAARRDGLAIQFPEPWDALREKPHIRQFVANNGMDVEKLNRDGFFALVEHEQVEALNAFKQAGGEREIRAFETDAIMPLYFWITDVDEGKRAVFALTQFEVAAHEVGFSTRSDNLIAAMCGIFDRYVKESEKAERDAAKLINTMRDVFFEHVVHEEEPRRDGAHPWLSAVSVALRRAR